MRNFLKKIYLFIFLVFFACIMVTILSLLYYMVSVIFFYLLLLKLTLLYYLASVIFFFFLIILFLQANLSRLIIRIQHRSKLQTRVSSYHSITMPQRSPSLAINAHSQDLSFFSDNGHFSA